MKSLRFLSIFTFLLITSLVKADDTDNTQNVTEQPQEQKLSSTILPCDQAQLPNDNESKQPKNSDSQNIDLKEPSNDVQTSTTETQLNLATWITYAQSFLPAMPEMPTWVSDAVTSVTESLPTLSTTENIQAQVEVTADSFEAITASIQSLKDQLSQEEVASQDYAYFKKAHNLAVQLDQNINTMYEQAHTQLQNDRTALSDAYQAIEKKHHADFKTLTPEQKIAANTQFNAIKSKYLRDMQRLQDKDAAIEKDHDNAKATHDIMSRVFHDKIYEAANNAQINFIEHLQNVQTAHYNNQSTTNLPFDESHATSIKDLSHVPSIVWSTLLHGSDAYTFQANPDIIQGDGLAQQDGSLNPRFAANASHQAQQALAFTEWIINENKAEFGSDQFIGILKCKKHATQTRCHTMKDAFNQALQARKEKFAEKKAD